jgi:hypothetical protein
MLLTPKNLFKKDQYYTLRDVTETIIIRKDAVFLLNINLLELLLELLMRICLVTHKLLMVQVEFSQKIVAL